MLIQAPWHLLHGHLLTWHSLLCGFTSSYKDTCQRLGDKLSQWSTCHVMLRTWVQYPEHTGNVLNIGCVLGIPVLRDRRALKDCGLASQPPYFASSRLVRDTIWNTKVDGQYLRMSLSFYICWHIYAYLPRHIWMSTTQTYMDTDMNMNIDTDMDTTHWVKEPNL